MKVGIYYFSGCGYSRWVALKAKEKMSKEGHNVLFCRDIQQPAGEVTSSTDADLFIFPVYFFGLPANVISYLKIMPMVAAKPAFLWVVDGGMSGMARRLGRFWLKDRGYEVISTREVVMPDTFLGLKSSQIPPEEREAILTRAGEKIDENMKDFVNPPQKVPVEPFFFSILGGFIYFLYLYCLKEALAHCFVATSKCTKCGLCAKDCPVRCIQIKRDFPVWKNGCVGCFRCVNHCPAGAIDFSGAGLLFGVTGAFCGFLLLGLIPVFSTLFALIGLFSGFYLGTFLFQKVYRRLPEKGLLFENKKRIVVEFKEKDL